MKSIKWPKNKRFAVCLTHDVDEIKKTYQYLTRSFRFLKSGEIMNLKNEIVSLVKKLNGKEPYWTFEEIMDLERKLGVKSTFFFLNETGRVTLFDRSTWRHYGRRYNFEDKKVAEIIRLLHAEGWEVGLHGSFYSYDDANLLKKEKEKLEKVLRDKVVGIRQHNLNLKIPTTWKIQKELGFEYDTSLGYNHQVALPWGKCFPFFPNDGKKPIGILEIPLIIQDTALFKYKNVWERCLKMIELVENRGGVLTILWHHSVFNEQEYPGWSEIYKKIIEVCKERNAWVTTGREIANWWKNL